MASRLGYDSDNATADTDSAGSGGEYTLSTSSDRTSVRLVVTCDSDDATSAVKVRFDPDQDPQVATSFDGSDPLS